MPDLDILTQWYTLLPLALGVKPIFSALGVDQFAKKYLTGQDGKPRFGGGLPSKVIDMIMLAIPVWVVVASAFLGPFWGRALPLNYILVMLLGPAVHKVFVADLPNDIKDPPDTIGEVSAYIEHKWPPFWAQVKETFSGYLTLSPQTMVVVGTILLKMSGPGTLILLGGLAIWLVLTQREWLSDVIAKGMVALAIVNFLGH